MYSIKDRFQNPFTNMSFFFFFFSLLFLFFTGGRKLEKPEETHMYTAEDEKTPNCALVQSCVPGDV